ncbi:MAG: hypothetical protein ABEN55_23120 [Bradymonadaceae bacterium]
MKRRRYARIAVAIAMTSLLAAAGCGDKGDKGGGGDETCSTENEVCCPDEAPQEGTSCCTGCGMCSYDTPACPEAVPIFECQDGEWKQVGHGDQIRCGDAGDTGTDASDADTGPSGEDTGADGGPGDTSSDASDGESSDGGGADRTGAIWLRQDKPGAYYFVVGRAQFGTGDSSSGGASGCETTTEQNCTLTVCDGTTAGSRPARFP